MPILINIHGPTASGKSTIITNLQRYLPSYAFVDRAYMKKMLQPSGKDLAKEISNKTTIFILKELMKSKKNIIVQEVGPTFLKKHLSKELKGYGFYSFYLLVSISTALRRAKQRKKKTIEVQLRKIHAKLSPEKEDTIIDTEKLNLKQATQFILKNVRLGKRKA